MGIILILLSHVLADFVFQWDNLVELKSSKSLRGFLYHGLILFTIQLFLLSTIYNISSVIYYTTVIVFIHILIDYLKESFRTNNPITNLFLFISDQTLHILIILVAFYKFTFVESNYLINIMISQLNIELNIVFINKLLTGIVILLYLSFGGAIFIRLFIDVIYRKVPNYMSIIATDDLKQNDPIKEVKVGKFVGILERIILFILLIKGDFSVVGFIIAAKSLTRFKQLENKNFAEYYLIGTFMSFLLTLIAVLLFQYLATTPTY